MLSADLGIILPGIILAIYAMLALLGAVYTVKDGAESLLVWVTSGLFLAIAVWIGLTGAGTNVAFNGMFVDDGFARFAKIVILVSAAAVLLMSEAYMTRRGLLRFEYPLLIALAVVGMMMMVSAGDLMALYMGLELQSLALYVVASLRRDSAKSTEAGLKYFVLGALSSRLLLYDASLTYGYTGMTLFSGIIASAEGQAPIGLLIGIVFVISGLAFKVSAVPFHMWTPDVYEGAPTPITAFFATAPKIAALYDLTDSLSVFGSYAYTERLPSGDEEFDYRGDLIQNHLKKERAHSVEIGFGQDLQDVLTGNDALAYKVTAFRNHVTDLIVRNAGGDFENVASANLWGVELEGSYEAEYAFAGLAASVIRGEDADSGEPLNNIAPDEIALTIGGKIPDHYLRFGWDARFVAAQTRVSTASGATPPSDPFNVHDIFASWKPEDGALAGFEVIGRVDNLFDKEYQEYLITSGPSKGRTFKVSVAKTFNF